MENITWKNEIRKVSELIPSDYNPRKISLIKKEELKKSLEKLGMIMPIIINTNNKVIGGHQRLSLLADLEIEDVDVRVPNRELNEVEEKEANLTTNINQGEWDYSKLIDNFDFKIIFDAGFDKIVFDKIINKKEEKESEEISNEKIMCHIHVSVPGYSYNEAKELLESLKMITGVKYRQINRKYKE